MDVEEGQSNMAQGPESRADQTDTPIPQLLESRSVYSNPWLTVREDTLRWPGSSDRQYGIVSVRPGVTVVALDESSDMVWCVRQYRPAIAKVSLELVSGAVEDDESPRAAAERELAEEVGIAAGRWDALGFVDGATAVIDSRAHLFLARELSPASSGHDADDAEEIRVQVLPWDEAVRLATEGEITHAASACALLRANRRLGTGSR